MHHPKLSGWVTALTLAILMAPPGTADAQDADTLSISGTFNMDQLAGSIGADLADVFARDNEHWWSLTLHGVTYSHASIYNEFDDQFATLVHATSFDFQLFGPDEGILNQAVSQQLMRGGLGDDVFLELRNIFTYWGGYWYATWDLGLFPLDPDAGISFLAGHGNLPTLFPWDANYYPAVEPQRVLAARTVIADHRSGLSGDLMSLHDAVDIGSSEQPAPSALSIEDGQVLEGDRYTPRLLLAVTLSPELTGVVTVDYQTAEGTASAKSDYYSTSGRLTFWPGETRQTITVWIRADRKREANETFTVQLSSSTGAIIGDAIGTVTIVNDD